MSSGIASLHRILKDATRRKIVLLLHEKGSLSYVDLMKALEITNTGKMNYHLKVLGELVLKQETGQYALSDKGRLAYRLLVEFPSGGATAASGLPTGVSVVSALTLFSSFAFGLFAFAIAAYLGSGTLGTSNPPPSPTTTLFMVASLLVLALASFVSSFFVLRGFSARVFWYIMNAVWLGLLAYSSTLHFQFWTAYYSSFANTYSEPVIALVLLSPFVYAISCIVYFLTKKPRKYFHIMGDRRVC